MYTFKHFSRIIFLLISCYLAEFTKAQAFFVDGMVSLSVDSLACCTSTKHYVYLLDKDRLPPTDEILAGTWDDQFLRASEYASELLPDTYYWGVFILENKSQGSDFLIKFQLDLSEIELYEIFADSVRKAYGGGLVAQKDKIGFDFKGRLDHYHQTYLPQNSTRKFYFKIRDESGRIENGLFSPRVLKIIPYFQRAHTITLRAIFFEGAVGIFLLLNFILFLYLRTQPFLYYVLYLASILFYGFYSSGLLLEFSFFKNLPPEVKYYFRLNYYLISISYLAFIRSFLDLKTMLPFWNTIFSWLMRIAFSLLVLSILYLALHRYNVALIDSLYGIYLIFAFIIIIIFLLRLIPVPDPRSNFILGGSLFIILGVIPVIATLMFGIFTIKHVIWVQYGLAAEMVVFSLGLAYSQASNERAKQEALRKKVIIEEKTHLYANITHEFRTPLTVILGMSEQIMQQADAKISEWAEAVQRNAHTLLSLINQVLAMDKLDEGNESMQMQQGDIIPFLYYLIESFQSYAASQYMSLHIECGLTKIMMDFDCNKIQTIISNLISNAIKFTEAGGRIDIKIFQADAMLHLVISDTGIGIPEKELPYIFDRYHQIHNTTGIGSGLGLTLVQKYIALWGGTISVESKLHQGTRFEIALPITRNADVISSFTPNPIILTEPPNFENNGIGTEESKPSLLLVEDNSDVLHYLSEILAPDYTLTYAQNGLKGKQMAIKHIPDLIISDIMMPSKNGFELCRELKADERTSHIPIILLTAKVDFDDRINGLNVGADVYLAKPFQQEELVVQIDRLLAQRQALMTHYSRLALLPAANHQVSPGEESFLHKAQSIVESRMQDENFGIKELYVALHISRSELHRKLKALIGQSSSEYIRNIRLHRAKDLLISTELNISEVAYQVGFSNSSYFSSSFKKVFGQSPNEYRNGK